MEHFAKQVKAADYDRFIVTLFAPEADQARRFVLYAFHAEIAKLPHSVSDPTLGLIRIAWWREALDEIRAGAIKKRHELVEALAKLPELPFAQMEALLDGYEIEIENPVAESLADLEQRILRTTHVLHRMIAPETTPEASLGYGLVAFLKSIYPLAKAGKPPLPLTMLAEEGAKPDAFGSQAYLAASRNIARKTAQLAETKLRGHSLPEIQARYYLKQLKRVDYDVLRHDISQRGIFYYLPLFLARK